MVCCIAERAVDRAMRRGIKPGSYIDIDKEDYLFSIAQMEGRSKGSFDVDYIEDFYLLLSTELDGVNATFFQETFDPQRIPLFIVALQEFGATCDHDFYKSRTALLVLALAKNYKLRYDEDYKAPTPEGVDDLVLTEEDYKMAAKALQNTEHLVHKDLYTPQALHHQTSSGKDSCNMEESSSLDRNATEEPQPIHMLIAAVEDEYVEAVTGIVHKNKDQQWLAEIPPHEKLSLEWLFKWAFKSKMPNRKVLDDEGEAKLLAFLRGISLMALERNSKDEHCLAIVDIVDAAIPLFQQRANEREIKRQGISLGQKITQDQLISMKELALARKRGDIRGVKDVITQNIGEPWLMTFKGHDALAVNNLIKWVLGFGDEHSPPHKYRLDEVLPVLFETVLGLGLAFFTVMGGVDPTTISFGTKGVPLTLKNYLDYFLDRKELPDKMKTHLGGCFLAATVAPFEVPGKTREERLANGKVSSYWYVSILSLYLLSAQQTNDPACRRDVRQAILTEKIGHVVSKDLIEHLTVMLKADFSCQEIVRITEIALVRSKTPALATFVKAMDIVREEQPPDVAEPYITALVTELGKQKPEDNLPQGRPILFIEKLANVAKSIDHEETRGMCKALAYAVARHTREKFGQEYVVRDVQRFFDFKAIHEFESELEKHEQENDMLAKFEEAVLDNVLMANSTSSRDTPTIEQILNDTVGVHIMRPGENVKQLTAAKVPEVKAQQVKKQEVKKQHEAQKRENTDKALQGILKGIADDLEVHVMQPGESVMYDGREFVEVPIPNIHLASDLAKTPNEKKKKSKKKQPIDHPLQYDMMMDAFKTNDIGSVLFMVLDCHSDPWFMNLPAHDPISFESLFKWVVEWEAPKTTSASKSEYDYGYMLHSLFNVRLKSMTGRVLGKVHGVDGESSVDPSLLQDVKDFHESAKLAGNLVEDLLAANRFGKKRKRKKKKACGSHNCTDSALILAKKNAAEKGVDRVAKIVQAAVESSKHWPFADPNNQPATLCHWATGLYFREKDHKDALKQAEESLQLAQKLDLIYIILMAGVDPWLFKQDAFETSLKSFTHVPTKIYDWLVGKLFYPLCIQQTFGIPWSKTQRKKRFGRWLKGLLECYQVEVMEMVHHYDNDT